MRKVSKSEALRIVNRYIVAVNNVGSGGHCHCCVHHHCAISPVRRCCCLHPVLFVIHHSFSDPLSIAAAWQFCWLQPWFHAGFCWLHPGKEIIWSHLAATLQRLTRAARAPDAGPVMHDSTVTLVNQSCKVYCNVGWQCSAVSTMHDTCPSAHTNSTCHFRFFGRLHKLSTTPRTCPHMVNT